jgi:hypothetical protein
MDQERFSNRRPACDAHGANRRGGTCCHVQLAVLCPRHEATRYCQHRGEYTTAAGTCQGGLWPVHSRCRALRLALRGRSTRTQGDWNEQAPLAAA